MDSTWAKSTYSGAKECLEARWVTSSYSAANECLQARWQKSTRSNPSGCCVEARQDGVVQVRDSKLGDDSGILSFTPDAWDRFLSGIR